MEQPISVAKLLVAGLRSVLSYLRRTPNSLHIPRHKTIAPVIKPKQNVLRSGKRIEVEMSNYIGTSELTA